MIQQNKNDLNAQTMMSILNDVSYKYEPLMVKDKYYEARGKIKHLIANDCDLIVQKEFPLFETYCNKVYKGYMPAA